MPNYNILKLKFWSRALLITGLLFLGLNKAEAQQGVGTNQPSKVSVVEMKSTNKGLLIPRVQLQNLQQFNPIIGENETEIDKVNSLLVYHTGAGDIAQGYYYWTTDGTDGQWNRLINQDDLDNLELEEPETNEYAKPKYFYMPSYPMPLNSTVAGQQDYASESGGTYTIELYEIYSQQFGAPAVSSEPGGDLPTSVLNADQLIYHITYYDETVFDDVTVSNQGVLTYTIQNNAEDASALTYMNIVFEVKED